jgi:hypothetical protein
MNRLVQNRLIRIRVLGDHPGSWIMWGFDVGAAISINAHPVIRAKTVNPLDLHMPNCVDLDLTQTSNRLKAMEVPIMAMSVWTDMRLTCTLRLWQSVSEPPSFWTR